MLTLQILGDPLPWKAPYVSCKGAFSVRTPIMHQLKQQLRLQLEDLYNQTCNINWFDGPIAVDLTFLMPIPKSTSKRKRMEMLDGTIRPDKRPDRGNLLKLIEDVLQGIVMEDDAHIVDGRVAKYYDDEPRTIIRIYPFDQYESMFGRMHYAIAQGKEKHREEHKN